MKAWKLITFWHLVSHPWGLDWVEECSNAWRLRLGWKPFQENPNSRINVRACGHTKICALWNNVFGNEQKMTYFTVSQHIIRIRLFAMFSNANKTKALLRCSYWCSWSLLIIYLNTICDAIFFKIPIMFGCFQDNNKNIKSGLRKQR